MSAFIFNGGFPGGTHSQDGPRYWALGNSMAVPVMRWIRQRIATVDAILRDIGMRRLP